MQQHQIKWGAVLLAVLLPTSLAIAFTDVSSSNPHNDAIQYLQQKGAIQGYSDGTFRPDSPINRAEFLKILLKAKSPGTVVAQNLANCFPDVATAWYAPYVCYAKSQGIISGYPDGKFRPESNINLAEALKMVLETYDIEMKFFTTADTKWYEPYYWAAESNGWLDQINHDIGHAITRGEIAQLIFSTESIESYQTTTEDQNPPLPSLPTVIKSDSNYLIIAADDLFNASYALKEYREKNGYNVSIVKLSDIDSESISAEKIDQWIENYANSNSRLKYIALVGDANILPSFEMQLRTMSQPQSILSDLKYALPNNTFPISYLPTLYVGRIAAKNEDEIDSYLEKVKNFEQNFKKEKNNMLFWGQEVTFMAAIKAGHLQKAKDLGYNVETIPNPTKEQLTAAINGNSDIKIVVYYGHGNRYKNDVLTTDTIEALSENVDHPFIYLTTGCGFGVADENSPTLMKMLLFGNNRGAAIAIGTYDNGGYGYRGHFANDLFDALQTAQTAGEMFNGAVWSYNSWGNSQKIRQEIGEEEGDHYLLDTNFDFTIRLLLYGDPALALK